MTYKALLFFSVVLAMAVANPLQRTPAVEGYHYNQTEVMIIELSEPCVRQGGNCVREEDCDESNRVKLLVNLCTTQHHLGVVCCYS